MSDKPLAIVFALPVMVGCCVGAPLLVAWLAGAGLFAWLADNTFVIIAVAVVPAVAYLLHRDRKRRRLLDAQPSAPPGRRRSPVK